MESVSRIEHLIISTLPFDNESKAANPGILSLTVATFLRHGTPILRRTVELGPVYSIGRADEVTDAINPSARFPALSGSQKASQKHFERPVGCWDPVCNKLREDDLGCTPFEAEETLSVLPKIPLRLGGPSLGFGACVLAAVLVRLAWLEFVRRGLAAVRRNSGGVEDGTTKYCIRERRVLEATGDF
jgi:hypothetical protein